MEFLSLQQKSGDSVGMLYGIHLSEVQAAAPPVESEVLLLPMDRSRCACQLQTPAAGEDHVSISLQGPLMEKDQLRRAHLWTMNSTHKPSGT